MTGPFDLPLWFLRDLIIVTIFSPIIFVLLKKLKIYALIVFFIAFISRIWPVIPGINISAWFFFSTGAYFAINNINIIQWIRKYAHYFIPLSIIFLSISIVYDGENTIIGQNVLPLYICAGVPSIFYLADILIKKFKIQANKFLVSSCFFVYAAHGIELPFGTPLSCVTGILRRIVQKICGGEILSYTDQLGVYIVSPFLTISFCLLLLIISRLLFPKFTLIFSGNK